MLHMLEIDSKMEETTCEIQTSDGRDYYNGREIEPKGIKLAPPSRKNVLPAAVKAAHILTRP